MTNEQQRLFEQLCASDSPSATDLGHLIQQHLNELRNSADEDEFLPRDLAEALSRNLSDLLKDNTLDPAQRRLVEGAARYFVSNQDDYPDIGEVFGLDDDLAVYNHVLEMIGRPALRIDE